MVTIGAPFPSASSAKAVQRVGQSDSAYSPSRSALYISPGPAVRPLPAGTGPVRDRAIRPRMAAVGSSVVCHGHEVLAAHQVKNEFRASSNPFAWPKVI